MNNRERIADLERKLSALSEQHDALRASLAQWISNLKRGVLTGGVYTERLDIVDEHRQPRVRITATGGRGRVVLLDADGGAVGEFFMPDDGHAALEVWGRRGMAGVG